MARDVGRGTRAFPDRPREHEAAPGRPMVRATSFAHTAMRSVQRKSRFVRDARMFLQAASFVYGRDAPVCLRVFRLPHIGRVSCRLLVNRDDVGQRKTFLFSLLVWRRGASIPRRLVASLPPGVHETFVRSLRGEAPARILVNASRKNSYCVAT